MNTNTYKLTVIDADGTCLAALHGSLALVNYAFKELELDQDADYMLTLTATEGIGLADSRTLTSVNADGESIGTIFRKKVAGERRTQREQEPAEPVTVHDASEQA